MEQKKCSNCKFSHEVALQKQIQCRHDTPKLFPFPSRMGGVEFLSTWPSVQENDWCGKYETDFRREVQQ